MAVAGAQGGGSCWARPGLPGGRGEWGHMGPGLLSAVPQGDKQAPRASPLWATFSLCANGSLL